MIDISIKKCCIFCLLMVKYSLGYKGFWRGLKNALRKKDNSPVYLQDK